MIWIAIWVVAVVVIWAFVYNSSDRRSDCTDTVENEFVKYKE
jgi:hypothetical protein